VEARDFTAASGSGGADPGRGSAFPLAAARFELSVHDPRQLPQPGAPEIAFAGRSNAGKSSAINTLAGRRRLAFVSKTPGRTQLINFFSLGGRAFLVDLPGYGYSEVPAAVRDHWRQLVGEYIAGRSCLAGVVVVMDARHPLAELDLTLLEWLRASGRRAHVLLTKADKLSKQAAAGTLSRVRERLAVVSPGTSVQLFSSARRQGVDEASRVLERFCGPTKQSPGQGE